MTSHVTLDWFAGAVIAREYGLPCVVNIANATLLFTSGSYCYCDILCPAYNLNLRLTSTSSVFQCFCLGCQVACKNLDPIIWPWWTRRNSVVSNSAHGMRGWQSELRSKRFL